MEVRYDNWLDDLYAYKDTEAVLAAICDTFIADNDTGSSWWGGGNDQTLAVLDLNKMENYFNKFEAMSAAIKNTVSSNKSTFNGVINSCKKYESFDRFGLFDGKDFLNKLASNSKFTSFATQINDAKTALSEMIIHNAKGSDAGNSNGFLLNHLKLDKPIVLIGHSMGGYTALNTLCLRKDITKAIAISPIVRIEPLLQLNTKSKFITRHLMRYE